MPLLTATGAFGSPRCHYKIKKKCHLGNPGASVCWNQRFWSSENPECRTAHRRTDARSCPQRRRWRRPAEHSVRNIISHVFYTDVTMAECGKRHLLDPQKSQKSLWGTQPNFWETHFGVPPVTNLLSSSTRIIFCQLLWSTVGYRSWVMMPQTTHGPTLLPFPGPQFTLQPLCVQFNRRHRMNSQYSAALQAMQPIPHFYKLLLKKVSHKVTKHFNISCSAFCFLSWKFTAHYSTCSSGTGDRQPV